MRQLNKLEVEQGVIKDESTSATRRDAGGAELRAGVRDPLKARVGRGRRGSFCGGDEDAGTAGEARS